MRRLIGIALLVAACGGGGASATDAPTDSPVMTPDPTPESPFGTGVITFGTKYDADTLFIVDPRERFRRTFKPIAWSASLSEPVGATSFELIIASQSKAGVEKTLIREDIDVSNPDNDVFANKVDLASLVDNKAGTYVMRYVRDGEILAEGTFTLVK